MRLSLLAGLLSRAGQASSRLAGLAIVAAIPIAGMAATIVWQDFQAVNRLAQERATLVEGQVLAQLQTAVAAVTVRAQAVLTAMAGAGCSPPQQQQPGSNAERMLLLDADGTQPCSGDELHLPPGLPRWFEQVRAGAPSRLGLLHPGGAIVVAMPAPRGAVAATVLPPGWLKGALDPGGSEPTAAAWVLDEDNGVVASAGDVTDALATLSVQARLVAARQRSLRGLSATNHRYAYATSILPGGWRLIAAISAEPEHARAVRVLLVRAGELGVLLLVGLAAVVVGADVAFGAPLRRLSASVQTWRAGEVFAPGDFAGAPDEVQQLARSFTAATAVLREQQVQLAEAQREQNLLLLEVHHRVKNNLQIVASLLNLQASRIRLPQARAEFQAARDRIQALATLHRHLYADGELQTINMQSFLTELCGQLFEAIGETEGDRIHLEIEATELRISSDDAVPLALIVTEAVTNSIRYAFPDGRPGRVCVSFCESRGVLDLVISDNGVGIPPSRAEDRERDGIGLRLIKGFSRQLGATLSVQHDGGTRYSIRLPLSHERQRRHPQPLDEAAGAEEAGSS